MEGKKKQNIAPDSVYSDEAVAKFINQVMRRGKKSIARKIVYSAFEIVKNKTKKEPLEVFELALENASPSMEVRSKRVGGATYRVPYPVKGSRQMSLAMRWLVEAAKKKKGKPMQEKLAQELIDASKKTGGAVKKKENIQRIAEANRAFAHFAR